MIFDQQLLKLSATSGYARRAQILTKGVGLFIL